MDDVRRNINNYYGGIDDYHDAANEQQCLDMLEEIIDCRDSIKRKISES